MRNKRLKKILAILAIATGTVVFGGFLAFLFSDSRVSSQDEIVEEESFSDSSSLLSSSQSLFSESSNLESSLSSGRQISNSSSVSNYRSTISGEADSSEFSTINSSIKTSSSVSSSFQDPKTEKDGVFNRGEFDDFGESTDI